MYDNFIVIAENEQTARETNPEGDWRDMIRSGWVDWSEIDDLIVIKIGNAERGAVAGTIWCSSHNDG